MSTSKGSTYKTRGILKIFEVAGVEVGSKNRPKIDEELKPKMDCLLASISGGFWWVLGGMLAGKSSQERKKID